MASAPPAPASWNPLRVTGTEMPPNLLLACKLIVVAFVANGQVRRLPGHFLPFFSALDRAGSQSAYRHGLQAAFLVAAVALLLNRAPHLAASVAGATILLGTVSSRIYFENNTEYTGLILLLAGLAASGDRTRLVRYQVVLLYAAAALNKLLDADWRSGQFFENWAAVTSLHAAYHHVSSLLPHLVLAKLLAWSAICTEAALAVGFAIRRYYPYAIWLAVGYHSTLMVTAGRTFGMFYFSLLASYLAFARPWPDGVRGAHAWAPARLRRMRLLDTDRVFAWEEEGPRLAVATPAGTVAGFAALRRILRFAPPAFFAFWILAALPQPDVTHRLSGLAVLAVLAVIAVEWARESRQPRAPVQTAS
ncbi:MAG TPA: HTTM domain-containing protein [Gaiellales bacterium]|nr:HTTM domain-containing protein [Gaiellales bacterium]